MSLCSGTIQCFEHNQSVVQYVVLQFTGVSLQHTTSSAFLSLVKTNRSRAADSTLPAFENGLHIHTHTHSMTVRVHDYLQILKVVQYLQIGLVLNKFLCATVKQSDVGVALLDGLSAELQDET